MQSLNILFKGKLLVNKKISVDPLIPWTLILLISLIPSTLTNINKKVQSLKLEPNHLTQPILKQTEVTNCLQALQKHFVLVPIDKTFKNITVICKRYYAEVILKGIKCY